MAFFLRVTKSTNSYNDFLTLSNPTNSSNSLNISSVVLLISNEGNSLLNDNDALYHMGYITLGTLEETKLVLNRIKGKKSIIDYSEKDFSKKEWSSIGVTTLSINGFIEGEINNKKQKVIILCNTHDLVKNVSNYYCAAPYSFQVRKTWFNKKILDLSIDSWNYYPVNYEEIPKLINEKFIKGVKSNEQNV